MNPINLIYLFFLLILFSQTSFAKDKYSQPPEDPNYLKIEISNGLTLDEAIKIATENSFPVKSKQSEVKQLEAQIKTQGARQNPFLEGSGSRSENTYFGGINYLIETAGKRKKRKEAALKRFEATQKEYESTIWDIRSTTRQLYSKLAVDEEWQKVKQERVALNEELLKITKKRFEAGDVPQVDIKLAEQALLNSKGEFITFKNELVKDRININSKLSLEPLSNWPIETTVQQLSNIPQTKSREELIKKSISSKPELKQALFNLQSAEAELKLAKANRIPNILQSLYVVTSNALDTKSPNPDIFTTSVRADTTVELPVFNRQQGPIAEAKAKIEKLSYDRIFLIQKISSYISEAYEKLKSMQEKVELIKKTVDSSKEITDLMQEGYTYGRMNLLQVLTAKQNLKQAQDNYYTLLIDMQSSVGELEKALGFSLSEAAS